MSGVNYFFRSATIISPAQRQLLLRRRGAPPRAGGESPPVSVFVGFRYIYSGRWESGKPAFGFPLFQPPSPPELWKCGNLARLWRDFQGARGKSGKPAIGFPRFPQPQHFHSSFLLLVLSRAADGFTGPPPGCPLADSSSPPPPGSSGCSAPRSRNGAPAGRWPPPSSWRP